MAPRLFACFGRGSSSSSSAAGGSRSPEANATADLTAEEQRRMGPVLVELFASQGCGTSPAAEAVVSRLGKGESGMELPPVVVLGFHVDYWDYRGWKDPFASSMWTVRQKAYVESLRLDTLYTPQVVVHGRTECLGTDQDAIVAAVRSAPRFSAPTMQATFQRASPDSLLVSLSGALRSKVDGGGADVMVALHESGVVTNCSKGENKDKVLSNDFVVRRLEKLLTVKDVSAKKTLSGTVQFALWDGFDPSKCGLVLFVQGHSLHTYGVQLFQLPDDL